VQRVFRKLSSPGSREDRPRVIAASVVDGGPGGENRWGLATSLTYAGSCGCGLREPTLLSPEWSPRRHERLHPNDRSDAQTLPRSLSEQRTVNAGVLPGVPRRTVCELGSDAERPETVSVLLASSILDLRNFMQTKGDGILGTHRSMIETVGTGCSPTRVPEGLNDDRGSLGQAAHNRQDGRTFESSGRARPSSCSQIDSM
jgi:hypothetical protein